MSCRLLWDLEKAKPSVSHWKSVQDGSSSTIVRQEGLLWPFLSTSSEHSASCSPPNVGGLSPSYVLISRHWSSMDSSSRRTSSTAYYAPRVKPAPGRDPRTRNLKPRFRIPAPAFDPLQPVESGYLNRIAVRTKSTDGAATSMRLVPGHTLCGAGPWAPRSVRSSVRRTASAAYWSASRMSSDSRSGYASRICFLVIPSATLSTTVTTGTRSPRIQGTPPIWPASTVA